MANLICGAPAYNHDFDFARQRLLAALYEAGGIQTNVARNYDDSEGALRGPWDLPVYQELVRRRVEWAARRREPS